MINSIPESNEGLASRLPEPLVGLDGIGYKALTPEDIDSYVAFDDWASFEANPETPKDHEPEHFSHDEIREAMESGDIFEAVVDGDNNFIGTLWFEVKPDQKELHIANLVVHPDYRDRGLGQFFMVRAEEIAKQQDLQVLTLHVDPLNSRGLNLYFRNGYLPVAYETDTAGGLNKWLFMAKSLGEQWSFDTAHIKTVKTGDEQGLQNALEEGYIGVKLELSADGDPLNNKVQFAKKA